MTKIAVWIATVGPVGRLPLVPGTWGSLAAQGLWYLTATNCNLWYQILQSGGVMFIGVWSAGIAEKSLGRDARPIVIDEVVGQWIVLIATPVSWEWWLASFILFRLLDIWKPFPAKSSQNLPGGWGVVADDVSAGLYGAAIILIARWWLNV